MMHQAAYATPSADERRANRPSRLGVVVIGRNEGERLRACLASLAGQAEHIVYVDSGSRDGSVGAARSLGTEVVELDRSVPFTAARARNAGFERLKAILPEVELVQFVDGDCELARNWLAVAEGVMARLPQAAVVCGRRRERRPDASIYNRLCDMEWDTPVGEAKACGGDALMRVAAFEQVAGFAPELIAGEEPDLCHRLRRRGWKIYRIPEEMTLHDAAMTRFSQWWKRNKRSGHASAEAWVRRGRDEPGLLKPILSNALWALPVAWPLWPLLWWRVFRRRDALYASSVVLGKLPHFSGQVSCWLDRRRERRSLLIEYK